MINIFLKRRGLIPWLLGSLLLVVACQDADLVLDAPSEVGSPSFSQSSDSIAWEDDVLEWTDAGTTWRFERDQYQATEGVIYEDAVLVAELDFLHSGSQLTEVRITHPNSGAWVLADADDGGVVDTSSGWGGCEPSHEDPECPEPEFVGDCEDELYAMVDAVEDAVRWWQIAEQFVEVKWVGAIAAAIAAYKTKQAGEAVWEWIVCESA